MSSRPLVNKLLTLEPLTIGELRYVSLDDALKDMGTEVTPEQLAAALQDAGVPITVTTLYRWKREGIG